MDILHEKSYYRNISILALLMFFSGITIGFIQAGKVLNNLTPHEIWLVLSCNNTSGFLGAIQEAMK